MKILVCAAMPHEMKYIKEWIKSAKIKANLKIDYLTTWIWNYETISNLENYLTLNPENTFIRNIWVCGYWNETSKKEDEVIQIATVTNIHTKKEIICPIYLQISKLKNWFSSETIIDKKPSLEIPPTNNERYFDMESRWISYIAIKHKTPFILQKVPFDLIWKESNSYKWKTELLSLLKDLPYKEYLEKILNRINQQKSE